MGEKIGDDWGPLIKLGRQIDKLDIGAFIDDVKAISHVDKNVESTD